MFSGFVDSLLLIYISSKFQSSELCEGRDGRPELPVPNCPYGLWGRKTTLKLNSSM